MLHVKSIGDPLHLKKQNTGVVLKKAGGNISLPQIKSFVCLAKRKVLAYEDLFECVTG